MLQDDIFKAIFKTSFDSTEANRIKQVTDEFPYFSLAHFFKLKKDTVYNENSTAKTALHFHNPYFLSFRLNEKENETTIHLSKENSVGIETVKENFTENIPALNESFHVPFEETTPDMPHPNGNVSSLPQDIPLQTQEMQIPVVDGALQHLLDKNSLLKPEEEIAKTEKPVAPDQKDTPVLKTEGAGNTETSEPNQDKGLPQEWLFEPLHTTDYFASQGIKISEQPASTDKLGKQLKSFTEWLKTMKKTSHYQVSPDAPIDHIVENLAEKSNEEQEVITETMAEAYRKQGKMDKATEIYKKLSLLNPSKSAYFATQIEILKEN